MSSSRSDGNFNVKKPRSALSWPSRNRAKNGRLPPCRKESRWVFASVLFGIDLSPLLDWHEVYGAGKSYAETYEQSMALLISRQWPRYIGDSIFAQDLVVQRPSRR